MSPGTLLPGVPSDWCDGVARLATMAAPDTITPARWAILATTSAWLPRDHGVGLHGARWDAVALFGLHPTAPMTHPPGWCLARLPCSRLLCRRTACGGGGEPGSRLAARLSMPTSGDTLLRLVRAAALPSQPSPRVVGIGDWAWRRGQRYGTIVCDIERERVIDLRPDRSVEVVAHDRAGVYAEGARQGAPKAKQVADRWHLLRNLGDALQGAADRHRGAVRRAARAVAHGAGAAPEEVTPASHDTKETRLQADRRARRLARYEGLRRLHGSGLSVQEVAPALGMSATAAYRWLKAGGSPTHDKPAQLRPLDPYLPHLEARWREGCRNGWRLWRELQPLGFAGSVNAVARWVARRRREDPPAQAAEVRGAAAWPEPSSRRCARLLTTAPDKLDAQEGAFLAHLAEAAPDLTQAGELASRFAALIRGAPDKEAGPTLDSWLADAKGTVLDAFARGIKRDHDAVLAALVEAPGAPAPSRGRSTG